MPTIFFICLITFCTSLFGAVDLEKDIQKFVISTKKITIEGYPDAFNPSIVRWNGKLLLSFRARDPLTNITNIVGLVWLDENFDPIAKPQILNIKSDLIQDPRLLIVDNRLCMPYSALCKWSSQCERRMCLAELYYDESHFVAHNVEPLLHFEGNGNKFEKNWVPFAYNDYLLLSYSIFPHKVFLPLCGEQKCLTVDYSEKNCNWSFGEIRGGTPALLVDGQYLAFFHSSMTLSSIQSQGKAMTHYFMGAYTFAKAPPFYVNKISSEPIIGKNFYNGPAHKTWKPLRVVFPGGFVFNEKYIWVAYGRQDHELWIVKIDKKGLLNSLISTKS